MEWPRYKKCCMCTDVRTGAIILAMIGILGAGFSVISDSVGLGYYAPMIEDRIEEEKIASIAKFQEERPISPEIIEQYEAYWQKLDFIKELVPWVFTVQIISSGCNILINSLMLFGVIKKRPGFMLPWLIIAMTCIVLSLALLSLGFFVFKHWNTCRNFEWSHTCASGLSIHWSHDVLLVDCQICLLGYAWKHCPCFAYNNGSRSQNRKSWRKVYQNVIYQISNSFLICFLPLLLIWTCFWTLSEFLQRRIEKSDQMTLRDNDQGFPIFWPFIILCLKHLSICTHLC